MKRVAERLLALRDVLDEKVPDLTLHDTLNLATWNIREFDSTKYGSRTDEAFFYIAEIVSRFDLVAIQEVREDLSALERLQEILGDWWKYVVTDVTEGRPGNRERMAFLYNERKVKFHGLAGEVVIPAIAKKKGEGKRKRVADKYDPARQLARTPFIAGFQAGWFRFMLCTVHILYGESRADDPDRVKEIEALAGFLARRTTDKHAWSKNLILLGDFNIFDTSDSTFHALVDVGFEVDERLQELPSNAGRNKHYDQIALMQRGRYRPSVLEAGVFDFLDVVYTDDDEREYVSAMGAAYRKSSKGQTRSAAQKRRYYRQWRTFQMSDHLPMWVSLKIDFGLEYLKQKAT